MEKYVSYLLPPSLKTVDNVAVNSKCEVVITVYDPA